MEIITPQNRKPIPQIRRSKEDFLFRLRSRLARPWLLNLLLALRGARFLPLRQFARYFYLRGSFTEVARIRKKVRSLGGWVRQWSNAAACWEKAGEEAETGAQPLVALEYFLRAADFYHAASSTLCSGGEARLRGMIAADRAFARAMDIYFGKTGPGNGGFFPLPYAEERELPGYLYLPAHKGKTKPPVVIIPGGADSGKEEYFHYLPYLLEQGLAVYLIDDPGVGISAAFAPFDPNLPTLYNRIRKLLSDSKRVNSNRIAILGASLGGWKAVWIATERGKRQGLRAVVSISGPYLPERYYERTMFLIKNFISCMVPDHGPDQMQSFLEAVSLRRFIRSVNVPVCLVVGGRDTVIPAYDGLELYHDLPVSDKQLIYLPDSDHVCMEGAQRVLPQVAAWLAERLH